MVIKKLHIVLLKEAEMCENENGWLLSDSWEFTKLPIRPDFSCNTLLLSELSAALTESLKLPSVPCCPKMAARVLYWAAAAGSN